MPSNMDVKVSIFCFLISFNVCVGAIVYDAYFGKPLTSKRSQYLNSTVNSTISQLLNATTNATGLCTVTIEPCTKGEGRRYDGSCVNPKYPSRGASLTPLPRLLPAHFGPGNTLRSAKDGSELPSTRLLRTTLLSDGLRPDQPFTQLASHTYVFSFVDNIELFYLLRYVLASDCCVGNRPNRVDPRCISIEVPEEDPYLRRSGTRCLNLTRVETYQDMGCIPNSLPAERYNRVPPLLDLTPVYGRTSQRQTEIRTYQGGELRSVRRGNRETPPGTSPFCVSNRLPTENTCYQYGDNYNSNLLVGTNLNAQWFYREHNRIARSLAKINPCWDDQKLFETARVINIAQWQFIFYYELIPNFIGWKNALAEGVIHDTDGYVNDFDPNSEPGTYHEYVLGVRIFHTFQDGRTDLYNSIGKYFGGRSTVDDAFRSGILEINNTEAALTQGAFRQSSAKFDDVIDIDLAERLFGDIQYAADLPAIDIMRGRDAGLPSYNEYRKLCGMPVAKKFEDFYDTIDEEKVLSMKRIYDHVDDVDLMTAVYIERYVPGGFVGPTLYCIMVNTFLLWRHSDLYFFEHGDHEAKLTLPQLNAIRKTSIAKVLCDSGDDVSEIQPHAFLQTNEQNKIMPCKEIPGIDLIKWRDRRCSNDVDEEPNSELKAKGKDNQNEVMGNWGTYWK